MRIVRKHVILADAMLGLAAFACAGAVLPLPSAAQEPPWEFTVTPYLWMTGIKAKVSPPGAASSHDLDVKFTDIKRDKINVDLTGPIIGATFRF